MKCKCKVYSKCPDGLQHLLKAGHGFGTYKAALEGDFFAFVIGYVNLFKNSACF